MTTGRPILFWFVLMLAAVANGFLREKLLAPAMSELSAHQVSTLTGMTLTGLAAWVYFRRHPLGSRVQAWIVGGCWLVLTLIFELGFGRYVAGHPWTRLLHDYDIAAGRLWPFFLLWILVMPYVFYRAGDRPG